jgi:hypothetical protein
MTLLVHGPKTAPKKLLEETRTRAGKLAFLGSFNNVCNITYEPGHLPNDTDTAGGFRFTATSFAAFGIADGGFTVYHVAGNTYLARRSKITAFVELPALLPSMDRTEDMDHELTLRQMGTTRAKLAAMVGAHSFQCNENNLAFKFKAKAKNKANYCSIELAPDDTYTVKFWKMGGPEILKSIGLFERVYEDSLKTLFETQTGLYVSL